MRWESLAKREAKLTMPSDEFSQARLLLRLEAQQQRLSLSLGRRLDLALNRAQTLSEAPAGDLERRSPSAESDDAGPRDMRGLMYQAGNETVADFFSWRLRILIENLEREVDAASLGSTSSGSVTESMEERDKRLIEYRRQGLAPREILLIDPAQGGIAAVVKAYKRIDKPEEE